MATVPLVNRFSAMLNAVPFDLTWIGKISLVTTQVTGPTPSEKLIMNRQSAASVMPAVAPPVAVAAV